MQIKLQGNGHVFQEIVSAYKRYIELGVLKEGEKLPSVRELAIDLGVNPNTVEKAYSTLSADGYVTVLPKKGAFVAPRVKDDPVLTQIRHLKESGITKDALLSAIETVYQEDHR
ncbi:MAG: GntR family transcriptional regulator [Clostridia bacterium]|nr:GntR family transcriptional regulator [Clostridia bacterium]